MSDKPRKKVKAKRKYKPNPVQKFQKDLVTKEKKLLGELRGIVASLNKIRNQKRRVTIVKGQKRDV